MGFAQELKDFVGAFEKGWKMATPSVAEVAAARDRRAFAEQEKEREMFRTGGDLTRSGSALDIAPSEPGYNPRGKIPTFANMPKDDFDAVVRTVYGEAAGEPPEGRKAVAAVIANRARAAGTTLRDEALKPNQFEPWGDSAARQRMLALRPTDPKYQQIASEVRDVLERGNDPTGGATHFYAPKAQAALGRSVPSWATGRGFRLGNHLFFKHPYGRGGDRHGIKRAALDIPEDEEQTVFAAEGGLLDYDYIGHDEDAGSNPAVLEAHETEGPPARVDPRQFLDVRGVSKMADDGMKYLQARLGLDGSAIADASPRTEQAAQALARNVGAPRPEEVDAIMKTVDPTGSLPREQRAVAGWNALYQFHTSRGNPEAAARAGAAMLMYSKQVSQRAGAFAMAALEKGDVKGAARAIQAAYEVVPDGQSVRVNQGGAGGLEYEVVDLDGKGLNKGKVTKEDLADLAKGMVDGTQWFQSVSAMREKANPTQQRAARRSAARTAFESAYGEENEDSFIAGLSEDARKKFLAMEPADRKEYIQENRIKGQDEAKAMRFEERMARQLENRDRREALDLFKFGTRYNQWETMREQVLTENERRARQREDEEAGRNNRQQLSFAERRKRDEEMIKRRTKTADGTGAKLTAKEAAEGRRVSAIDTGMDTAERAVSREAAIGDEGMPDYSEGQRTAIGGARAEAGYQRMNPKEREVSEEDFAYIRTKIPEVWKGEGVGRTEQLWAARIASDIRTTSGNQLTNDDAIDLMQAAVTAKSEPRVLRDGSVMINPQLPAVKMTGESLMALAALRGRAANTRRGNSRNTATVAEPGVSAPTSALEIERRAISEQRASEPQGGGGLSRFLGRAREVITPTINRADAERSGIDLLRRDEERRKRQRAIGNIR
jgi:spore germination cell wall hydrolase CwlJ-like protein